MKKKIDNRRSVFWCPCLYKKSISIRGGGCCSPPLSEKKWYYSIRAKLMYRSDKDTEKNILLYNILIYLFSSLNTPNLVLLHERIILCICDQQVLFGRIMFSPPPPQQNFSRTPMKSPKQSLFCALIIPSLCFFL